MDKFHANASVLEILMQKAKMINEYFANVTIFYF